MNEVLTLVMTNGAAPATIAADDEAGLVARARAGEMAAFEALYRRTCPLVFALCLRMAASRTQAEDLAQEAFVRAWQKLGSFRGEASFATWLTRLTVNVVLNARRSDRRGADRETASDDFDTMAAPAAAEAGSRIDLERAISTLPAGARAVFVLHDVHGFEHREIARMTGTAVGTSKAHLHRARQLLREVLS